MRIPPPFRPPVLSPFALGLAVLAGGCDAPQPRLTEPRPGTPSVAEYVTGDAALRLTPEGRFRIENGPLPTEAPTIGPERAGEQALAYVRTFAPHLGRFWQESRGAPIDYGSLEVGPRIFLASSPYGPIPPGRYHPSYRRAFGPFYQVTLTAGGEPVMLVAVSAFNADVRVERGRIEFSKLGGSEISAHAIPLDTTRFQPNSPEEAVHRVGRRFGVRVARAPELVLRGRDTEWSPAAPLWKLSLERDVPVRGRDRAFRGQVRDLYVGGGDHLFVPVPAQPASSRLQLVTGPPWPGPSVPVEIPVRPGAVVHYEEVVPDSEPR